MKKITVLAVSFVVAAFSAQAEDKALSQLNQAAGPVEFAAVSVPSAQPSAPISGESKLRFFEATVAYAHRGIVRFAPEVAPEEVYAYFNSIGVDAREINYDLNTWLFGFDESRPIREALVKAGDHPKALYVVPERNPSADMIPQGKDVGEMPGEAMVAFRTLRVKKDLKAIESMIDSVDALIIGSLGDSGVHIRFDPKTPAAVVVDALTANSEVEWAEANSVREIKFGPSRP